MHDYGRSTGLPQDTERLIRLLGMMDSADDGEALNAARLAVKWVKEHKTDWRTLLSGGGVIHRDEPSGYQGSWHRCATLVLKHYNFVLKGEREREFLHNRIHSPHRALSERQEQWLRDICGRAGLWW